VKILLYRTYRAESIALWKIGVRKYCSINGTYRWENIALQNTPVRKYCSL